MDPPGGGPGPPRPAPPPVQNIAPAPQETSLRIFPFNAAQQQAPLALQIGHGAASIPIANHGSSPFDASEPFGNNAFLAGIPGRPETDANPLNPAQNINSATAMLQNVNQRGANSQSGPIPRNQQRQATPQQVSHQTSRDLFGELEKALSVSGPPQNAADFDVLDHAIAGGSQQPPPQQVPIASNTVTSQPQQPQGVQPWPQSQSQGSHAQRAVQIQHQSQMQNQLQQQQQQQQIRQRQLQQQAHIAQQQQLRQQHFQNQQIRQQQLRQQQQFGQLRHLQPQPQQPNVALMNQAHQQSQPHQTTQSQAQSQPQQSQQQQQSLQLAQQAQQRRTQPMHHYPPKLIQPAVILPVQGQGNVPYPAGLVGQPNIGSAGQMQNSLGNRGMTTGGQPVAIGSGAQQAATTPAVQPSKSKTKPKKQSQRRPRARSQAKNLQARSSQSQSPSASQSSGQQAPHTARVSQLPTNASPEQMRAFAAQQQYISPPQHIQPSPPQMQRTPQQTQQSRKQHELQTRLLQQRQLPHQTNHVQPSIAPMGSSSFLPNTTFAPSVARSSPPHRGSNVNPGNSSPFGAQQMSQSSGFSAALQPSQLPQLPANELASIAKFDRATLEKILSRTTDPKLYAALHQQLQILHGNGSGQAVNSSHPSSQNTVHIEPQGQVLQQGSTTSPVSKVHPRSGGQHGLGTGPLPSSQATLPNQQQLVQQQRGYNQQQPQQLHRPQRPLSVGQQPGAPQIFPRGVAYRQSLQQSLGVMNPHASQSVASLPQYVQHQIQADIQAQHIQAQLQSQSKLKSQRNSGMASPGSFPTQSQNITTVLPQRSPSPPENRKPRKSLKSSKQNVVVSQANGAVASNLTSRTNVKPSLPLAMSGPQPPIGAVQFSQQLHMSSVPQPQGPGRSAALPQAVLNVAGNQSAQLAQSAALRNAAARRVAESKKLINERRRLAREAEMRELAVQKKRRLETAPSSDYQGVLAPDFKTPFASPVNAWQRLMPFHVLLSKDEAVSSEDWNAETTKLCEKYREGFRDLREKVITLPDRASNFVTCEVPGLGQFELSNDDCVVMETVILEDVYETARQERALQESKARAMARQRAIEMEAARRAAEQAAVAVAAAREASMRSERERKARVESERMRAMSSGGMYVQGSPGNDQGTSLTSGISGGKQIFGAPQAPDVVNNSTSIGTPVQVPRQAENGQAYQNHVRGYAPTSGMLMFASDGGQSRPVSTAHSSQGQLLSDGANRHATSRNTASGISQAFQQAHQTGIPHIQVQGYQSSAQRGSQQVAGGIQGQQSMAVRSNTPVSSHAWVGNEMLTANTQSTGHNNGSRALGCHTSNGMNSSAGSGTQTAVNGPSGGIGSHAKVLNSKNGPVATSSQQFHLSHERPVPYRAGSPPGRGAGSASLGPRGQPVKTSTGAVLADQGSISQSNGFGVTSMGQSSAGRPADSNHIGNVVHASRGGASNHIIGRQLPNYPGSMQGQGTPTTAQASSLAQAGHNSRGAGMNPLQQGTDTMRSVHSSSHLPLVQAVKPSPTHPYATPAAAPNAAGQAVGSNGTGQHGGKERRGMGMGSLLNADRS